jgi:glycosyltransferase involved in cell wall biosynthesis
MKDYLVTHDFLLPNTHLIPNGVDTTRFTPTAMFSAERAQTVICVARLAYQKGIDVLLQAWYIVQQEFPQARLLVVGTGPSEEQLTHLTQALRLEKSVEFVGLQHDIPAQLHRAGIAVLPSRCEGMPNAVLEAMACELPCVATRVSGSEDIIQHGVNGLLVEIEDYQGMAEALLILLREPALARNYGYAAHTTIVKNFSLEYITEQYIALYRKVLADKHQRDANRTEGSNTDFNCGKDAHSCVE